MTPKKFSVIALLSILQLTLAFPPLQLNISNEIRHFPEHRFLFHKGITPRERLPNSAIPIHYSISLTPILDPEDVDFKKAPGEVTIRIKCLEESSLITMHSSEIIIGEGAISVKDVESGDAVHVTGFQLDDDKETLEIMLESSLTVDKDYEVNIVFEARVADDRLNGLYLSQYVEPDTGKINYHAATQFEDIGARKAFPCYDEPALKATFEMRLGRKENFTTLWNTPLSRSEPMSQKPNYFWDIYPPSPVKMSVYLMAIVSSNFEDETAPEGLYTKPVKIWGPISMMESSDHGVFAAETAAKVLRFFDEYLDHEYDFPKMDSVAVPEFSAGAMENWGLNLYRTQYLLFTPGESTQANKWSMASVLAHELAHQWWGNLVTMQWWNAIWLNEGFANYMQFHGSNNATPQFTPSLRVNTDTLQNALNFDAGPQSTQVYMTNEVDVVNAPSAIIYDKGASIIRMMQGLLTEDSLIKGLRTYLKEKAYGNAVQDELFQILTTQAHSDGTLSPSITVKQIMDTWTLQAGYPLIRVSRAGTNRIYLSQTKFLNDPKIIPDGTTWYVPIPWVTKSNPEVNTQSLQPKTMIPPEVALISADVETTDEWILVNPDGKGFYRVLYDEYLTNLLVEQLDSDHNIISILSRGVLIDDYFKVALGEKVSMKSALRFTKYLNKERELAVWIPAVNNLKILLTKVADSDIGVKFFEYLRPKFDEVLESIGLLPVDDEAPTTTILRSHLLDFACAIGSTKCYEGSLPQMENWVAEDQNGGSNPIWADFQPSVYCAGVWQGGDAIWDFVMKKYSELGVTVRQRTLLLNALACLSDEEKLTELLTRAIGTEQNSGIRDVDAPVLLQRISENSAGRQAAFTFIQNRVLVILASRVGETGIRNIVSGLGTYFNTEDRLVEMTRYLEDNKSLFSESLISHINSTIVTTQSNIDWMSTHGADIGDFLISP